MSTPLSEDSAEIPAETPSKPDAVRIPAKMKFGGRMPDRVNSVATLAEKILGLDRSKKQLARIHIMGINKDICFCTPPPHDGSQSVYFATTHPRAGEDRYRWEVQEDGTEFGYKVEGADDAE